LAVDWHPNGNRTLKESINGSVFKDLNGPLLCNPNSGEFYRAAAKWIAKRAKEYKVTSQDDFY
jgi:S-methylmethionine-dependent homocysteine/selenocysteine methylase